MRLHEERYWTRERIIEVFQEFYRRHGRSPSTGDTSLALTPSFVARNTPERVAETIRVRALGPKLPLPNTVQAEFEGGWHEALTEAGLPRNPQGHNSHVGERRRHKPLEGKYVVCDLPGCEKKVYRAPGKLRRYSRFFCSREHWDLGRRREYRVAA